MVKSVEEVLEDRGKHYGNFRNQAEIQMTLNDALARCFRIASKDPSTLPADQLAALGMIVVKLARIINGDNNYADSWVDIAGYATLISDSLDDTHKTLEINDSELKPQDAIGA